MQEIFYLIFLIHAGDGYTEEYVGKLGKSCLQAESVVKKAQIKRPEILGYICTSKKVINARKKVGLF